MQEILDKLPNGCSLTHARTDEDGRMVVVFSFSKEGFGFGEITVVKLPDGRSFIDTERTNKDKILDLLAMFVDQAVLDTDKDSDKHLEWNKAMRVRSCGCCGYHE